jgi:hypothetical protein
MRRGIAAQIHGVDVIRSQLVAGRLTVSERKPVR